VIAGSINCNERGSAGADCNLVAMNLNQSQSATFDYFDLWNWDGTLDRIHHELYVKCREQAAREASPTACLIDSQGVKSAEKGGLHRSAGWSLPLGQPRLDPRDAGKNIKGKKRPILVDTCLLLRAVVHPADLQDRDGGGLVLSTLFGLYPLL
jgi:hypothetical protein